MGALGGTCRRGRGTQMAGVSLTRSVLAVCPGRTCRIPSARLGCRGDGELRRVVPDKEERILTGPGQEVRKYRVEHWGSDRARVLAIVDDVVAHRTTLVPYASRLLMEGVTGKVVFLDDGNDTVLATY